MDQLFYGLAQRPAPTVGDGFHAVPKVYTPLKSKAGVYSAVAEL